MIHQTGYWHSDFAKEHHVHSQKLSNWIVNFLKEDKTKLIYDFGCGMGTYLNDLYNNDHKNIIGLEAMPPKNDYPFSILSQNLAIPFSLGEKGNVISLEVGEHIPPEYMGTFLSNLAIHCSNYLIISWAVRGQGGLGHYNELNNDEIIPLITNMGFEYMEESSMDARKDIEDNFWWFKNTLMVFKKVN